MLTPFPPFDERPLQPKFGAGMDRGQTKRTGATVDHSMLGSLSGTDAYFRRWDVKAATHWGIGGALDGSLDGKIYQWIEMGSLLIPWASGPWRAPGYGDGGAFVEKYGVYGINAYAESIEFSGQLETPMTVRQWRAGIWLSAAIKHAGGISYDESLWNFHHREFTQPDYKDCPFPRFYKYTAEYQAAIALVMRHYETGKDVPEYASVAGLQIPLPVSLETAPRPTPTPTKPIFQAFPNPRLATVFNCVERKWGHSEADILAYHKTGDALEFIGFYHGENVGGNDRWYVVDDHFHGRIHGSGIRSWG